jgi:hypothetical protein
MKNTKDIRVTFDNESDRKAAADLAVLGVIKGVSFEKMLAASIALYNAQPDNAKELNRGTWVSQTELIERLKQDFNITTNFQTLLNYRNENRFNGLYCSDGKKKVFYLLEGVAEKLQEPRERRTTEKTAATNVGTV